MNAPSFMHAARLSRHISISDYQGAAALRVLEHLDEGDRREVEMARARQFDPTDLLVDFHCAAMTGGFVKIAWEHSQDGGARPIALIGIARQANPGIAQAAMLARPHRLHVMPLARLVLAIRRGLPAYCAEQRIHRIEARCWADHQSAARMLTGIGFRHECDVGGYGYDGRTVFRQFSFIPAGE